MKVSDVRRLVREAIEEIGGRRGMMPTPKRRLSGQSTCDGRLIVAEQANPLDAECPQCGAESGNACFRDRHHEGGFTSFNEYDLMPKGEYHSSRYNRANWDKYGQPYGTKG